MQLCNIVLWQTEQLKLEIYDLKTPVNLQETYYIASQHCHKQQLLLHYIYSNAIYDDYGFWYFYMA